MQSHLDEEIQISSNGPKTKIDGKQPVFGDNGEPLTVEEITKVAWKNAKQTKGEFTDKLEEQEVIREVITSNSYYVRELRKKNLVFSNGNPLTKDQKLQVRWDEEKQVRMLGEEVVITYDAYYQRQKYKEDSKQYVFDDGKGILLSPEQVAQVKWENKKETIGKLFDQKVIRYRLPQERLKIKNGKKYVFDDGKGILLSPEQVAQVKWENKKETIGKLLGQKVITYSNYKNKENDKIYVFADDGAPLSSVQIAQIQQTGKKNKTCENRKVITQRAYKKPWRKFVLAKATTPKPLSSEELAKVEWLTETQGLFKGEEVMLLNTYQKNRKKKAEQLSYSKETLEKETEALIQLPTPAEGMVEKDREVIDLSQDEAITLEWPEEPEVPSQLQEPMEVICLSEETVEIIPLSKVPNEVITLALPEIEETEEEILHSNEVVVVLVEPQEAVEQQWQKTAEGAAEFFDTDSFFDTTRMEFDYTDPLYQEVVKQLNLQPNGLDRVPDNNPTPKRKFSDSSKFYKPASPISVVDENDLNLAESEEHPNKHLKFM